MHSLLRMPLAERHAVLTGNTGWFGQAPREFQQAVLALADWRVYRAGTTVYRGSDARADLFGFADGSVEVYPAAADSETPLLTLLHEGAWGGMGSVLTGAAPRLTMVARVNTLAACVPRVQVQRLLNERPEWWRVLGLAAMEYGDLATAMLAEQRTADNEQRCARVLLRLTGLRPPRRTRADRSDAVLTQEELATLVGVSRTTIVQVLRGFERRGLIEHGYRLLRVSGADGLAAIAARRA